MTEENNIPPTLEEVEKDKEIIKAIQRSTKENLELFLSNHEEERKKSFSENREQIVKNIGEKLFILSRMREKDAQIKSLNPDLKEKSICIESNIQEKSFRIAREKEKDIDLRGIKPLSDNIQDVVVENISEKSFKIGRKREQNDILKHVNPDFYALGKKIESNVNEKGFRIDIEREKKKQISPDISYATDRIKGNVSTKAFLSDKKRIEIARRKELEGIPKSEIKENLESQIGIKAFRMDKLREFDARRREIDIDMEKTSDIINKSVSEKAFRIDREREKMQIKKKIVTDIDGIGKKLENEISKIEEIKKMDDLSIQEDQSKTDIEKWLDQLKYLRKDVNAEPIEIKVHKPPVVLKTSGDTKRELRIIPDETKKPETIEIPELQYPEGVSEPVKWFIQFNFLRKST